MKCAVCGDESTHLILTSTHELFPTTVVLFPAPMDDWVVECRQCGYVGNDLNASCELPKEKLQALYNEVEMMHDWPSSQNGDAKRFAKFGYFLATTGKHSEASWQFLYAAAVFDDIDDPLKALLWLTRANDQFEICLKNKFSDISFCMCVYTLMRIGQMRRVLEIVPPADKLSKRALCYKDFMGVASFDDALALEENFGKFGLVKVSKIIQKVRAFGVIPGIKHAAQESVKKQSIKELIRTEAIKEIEVKKFLIENAHKKWAIDSAALKKEADKISEAEKIKKLEKLADKMLEIEFAKIELAKKMQKLGKTDAILAARLAQIEGIKINPVLEALKNDADKRLAIKAQGEEFIFEEEKKNQPVTPADPRPTWEEFRLEEEKKKFPTGMTILIMILLSTGIKIYSHRLPSDVTHNGVMPQQQVFRHSVPEAGIAITLPIQWDVLPHKELDAINQFVKESFKEVAVHIFLAAKTPESEAFVMEKRPLAFSSVESVSDDFITKLSSEKVASLCNALIEDSWKDARQIIKYTTCERVSLKHFSALLLTGTGNVEEETVKGRTYSFFRNKEGISLHFILNFESKDTIADSIANSIEWLPLK